MLLEGARRIWGRARVWLRPLSHAGVPANATLSAKRELVTANVVVLFSILATLPDAINYFNFPHLATERAAVCASTAIAIYVTGFILIFFGLRFIGVLIFTITVLANLSALTIILGTDCGVQYYFIAVGVGAMFVWPRTNKYMRVPLAVGGLVLFVVTMRYAHASPIAGGPLSAAVVASIFQRTSIDAYLITFALAFYSLYSTEAAELELEKAHRQSESLLLNILPHSIAVRLKEKEESIADGFDNVTILFADVVGFTPLSEKLDPAVLVAFLNRLFSEFDRMAEALGLEKIKTIGDAYMVAGGIPEPRRDHASAIAKMAVQMQAFVSTIPTPAGQTLRLRIGINTGPAIAGVIGLRKFTYDLWGDAVNTAARMESHGIPGEIQVTERTRMLLDDEYEFEERGVVEIKGKGPMVVSLLRGAKTHATE
jgi:class 3 adenylate cyclase